MKIEIERSGGITGITRTVVIETKNLPKSMAMELETYLFESNVSNKLNKMKIRNKIPDCYNYKLSGRIKNKNYVLRFNEFDVQDKIRSIVNHVFKNYEYPK